MSTSRETTVFRAVVFTDLVGSTELASQLGDDRWDAVRREHFEALRRAVERTGGTEVKTIGDAIMVSYESAAAAVEGAVQLQCEVEHANRGSVEDLAMRVGVSAGDVGEADGDLHGQPVTEAARLCAAAQGCEILVADIVRLLAGSRLPHDLEPIGDLELKGLPGPFTAHRVRLETGVDRIPLPAAATVPGGRDLAGRRHEWTQVETAWEPVTGGGSALLLFGGEPGIGKTRLARELARVVYEDGATVLWCRADEELAGPFRPWAEGLRHLARHGSAGDLARWSGDGAAEIARIVPGFAGAEVDDTSIDLESRRELLFLAVRTLVERLAAETPVLVVFDDAHWADRASLLLLREMLLDPVAGSAIAVTYRDTDLDRRHPLGALLADLRRERIGTRVPVRGLDAEGTRSLMANLTGHTVDAALVGAVHEETEGNPFFIEEVVAHLGETGSVAVADGQFSATVEIDDLGIPEGVREAVGRRLAALPDSTDDALHVAAVLGRHFDVDVLSVMLDEPVTDTIALLEPALQRRLVDESTDEGGRFAFSHALVCATLVEELSTARRTQLHGQAGRALEALRPTDVDAIAAHFHEASAAGFARDAARAAYAAATRALELLAWEDAAEHMSRGLAALDLLDEPDEGLRVDLMLVGADVASAMARQDEHTRCVLEAADVARRMGDDDRLVACARAAVRYVSMFADPAMVELARDGLVIVGPEPTEARAELLGMLASRATIAEPFGDPVVLAEECLAVARQDGTVEAVASAAGAMSMALLGHGRLDERDRYLAMVGPDLRSYPGTEGIQRCLEAQLAFEMGDRARFDRMLDELDRIAEAKPIASSLLQAWRFRGLAVATEGRFEEAEAVLDEGMTGLEGDDPTAGAADALQRIWLDLARDRPADSVERAETYATILGDQGGDCLVSLVALRTGDPEPARAKLDRHAADSWERIPNNWGRATTIQLLAEIAIRLEAREHAEAMLELFEPFAGSLIVWWFFVGLPGAADRFRGGLLALLDRPDDARAAFDAAERLEAGFGATVLADQTRRWRDELLES